MVQQGMVALLRGASMRWRWSPLEAPPLPSMYSLSRAFSSKLFVGGLLYRTGYPIAMASTRRPPAADRTFGNSDSSSSPPSGSTFGHVGSRPPVVEDLGPLPSYGTHIPQIISTAESNNTAYDGDTDSFNGSGQSINRNYISHQEGSDAFNGGQRNHNNYTMDVFNGTYQANVSSDLKPFTSTAFSSTLSRRSTFSMATSSTTFGAALPGNSSISVFQNSTSKFQSRTFGAEAFDISTFGTAVSATATQGTVTSSSMVLPDMSSRTVQHASESGSGLGLGLGEVSSLDDSSQSEIGLWFSSIDSPQAGRSGLSGSGQASSFRDTAESEGSGLGLMLGPDDDSSQSEIGLPFSSIIDSPQAQSDGSELGLTQGPDVSVAAQADSVDIIKIGGEKLRLGLTDVSAVSSPSTTSPSESSEDYDFRNFPALKGSFYQDYERPIELQRHKRHMVLKSSRKVLALQSKVTIESIPPPKRLPYDFGLGDIPSSPPPLEVGAKPQGGFDINMSLDDLNEASSARLPGYSISSQRLLPPLNLPWDTPEADNWSEIGEEPQRIEDSIDPPFNNNLKNDPEFWWDPYDFDAESKLPWQPEAEDPSAVNTTA